MSDQEKDQAPPRRGAFPRWKRRPKAALRPDPFGTPATVLSRLRRKGSRSPAARRLSELAAEIGAKAPNDAEVKGIALDSRRVNPGDLFVAVAGTKADGRAFAEDARARGAVAVVADEPLAAAPTLIVDNPRAAAARLAAALYDHPAERMCLIGVSGTLGKTSTTFLLRDIMAAHGEDLALVGSLGVRYGATVLDTGMTSPDAPVLQQALSTMCEQGVKSAAVEVTSHALVQNRMEGLSFRIGLLTNLVPDEHLEFHGTPEDYLRAKVRYFDMLAPGAPLVINADDPLVREHSRALDRPLVRVSSMHRDDAAVHVRDLHLDAGGSHFLLQVARPLPKLSGGEVPPMTVPVTLAVLGVQQVMNFALAATVALMTGCSAEAVATGASRARPIRRRMEIVREKSPVVLDDTVGNPRSLRSVLETARALGKGRPLRILFGMRGLRGPAINRGLGETLGELTHSPDDVIVVTSCEDKAGPRDRVQPDERNAFLEGLSRSTGPNVRYEPNLARAVAQILDGVRDDDLVLLLGAQGMDAAADLLRERLAARDAARDAERVSRPRRDPGGRGREAPRMRSDHPAPFPSRDPGGR